MSGYIAEFFGYNAADKSKPSLLAAARKNCPFLGSFCTKTLSRDKIISGVCAIRQKKPGSPNVICCPIRLYADDYRMLRVISEMAFKTKPQKALSETREIVSDTVGLNWENVSKRIIPQIIYKGQVLQREDLCRTGLYLVCPRPVYQRVLDRLGGADKLPSFPSQPASINFIAYDAVEEQADGVITPLGIVARHCTTVYKIQEAFSSLDLPEGNVYRDAISQSLYPERYEK